MDKNNDILMDSIDEKIEAFLRGNMSADEEASFKQELKENPELRHQAMTMASLIKGLQVNELQKESNIKESTVQRAASASIMRHNMSADEEASFKQDIKEDAELRHRAMTMAALIKGFQTKESLKESDIINSAVQKSAVASKKKKYVFWWTCSVAAAFVVIFGIYKVRRHNLLDETVAPYYMDYDLSNVSRGDVDTVTIAHLYTLFSQIQENRNMSDIIKELEPIYKSLDDDYTYHPWANDIAWNLALAYIKDDQINKAITILDKIKQDNPDTPFYSKADELIKRLSDL